MPLARRRGELFARLVRSFAAMPAGGLRLPPPVIASLFALRRRAAGLRLGRARVGRFELPFLEGGERRGEAVLFIHGFSDSKDSFVDVAHALDGRHRVVLVDLPGFGEASAPFDYLYDLDAFAEVVAGFCDAVGLAQAHLVGSSLGGAIATQLALERPERVRSLTLVGAAGAAMPTPSPLLQRLSAGDNPFVIRSLEGYRDFLRFTLERPPSIPGPVLRYLADACIARAELNAKIMDDLVASDMDLTPRLSEIKAETLVLWGDCDRLIDISAGRVFRDRIERSRMVVLHEVGHCPQYEAPQHTARYVRNHLDSVAARAAKTA